MLISYEGTSTRITSKFYADRFGGQAGKRTTYSDHFDSKIVRRIANRSYTCWHELFQEGTLSWGYDLDNPDAPFFHIPRANQSAPVAAPISQRRLRPLPKIFLGSSREQTNLAQQGLRAVSPAPENGGREAAQHG